MASASRRRRTSAHETPIPSAQVVGNAFVTQYYHVLLRSPELAHRFYHENSKFSRPEGNGLMSTTTTLQGINEKIASLGFGDTTMEIETVDTQESHNGGVIVLVTGKDNLKRRFVQSFFLAPQDNGYFTLNDIFRYVDDAKQQSENRGPVSNAEVHGGQASESVDAVTEQLSKMIETEEAVGRRHKQLKQVKKDRDKIMNELGRALKQKSLLEDRIAESDGLVNQLEEKIVSAVDLLQNYKRRTDTLQIERESALNKVVVVNEHGEASRPPINQFFAQFSLSEIEEATQQFDQSLKISGGECGSVYKGLLHGTEVAIMKWDDQSLQGISKFQHKIDILSKVRHPNVIDLIGVCPAMALVYEYLPNGCLKDRLCCSNNSAALSWQARIRIAAELCSTIIFLHSSKPHSIVHGNIRSENILLDTHFVSKLSGFGIRNCQSLSTACYCKMDDEEASNYMHPNAMCPATGVFDPESDIYSFGLILVELLTGRHDLEMKKVQFALDTRKLKPLLDASAGDWPFLQAEQLAYLAVRCCETDSSNRPKLETDAWKVLEPMRDSCLSSPSFWVGSEDHFRPPPYFMCPILQEIMQDPHIAADGYTYEAEALRGWLERGHDTSPMTNLKLKHRNLVPNHALRSAIQEWLRQH